MTARQGRGTCGAVRAARRGGCRIAAEATAVDDLERRQQASQGTGGGGLGGALFASDEDTAEARIDRVEHEGELHLVLSDQGTEREAARSQRYGHFVARFEGGLGAQVRVLERGYRIW